MIYRGIRPTGVDPARSDRAYRPAPAKLEARQPGAVPSFRYRRIRPTLVAVTEFYRIQFKIESLIRASDSFFSNARQLSFSCAPMGQDYRWAALIAARTFIFSNKIYSAVVWILVGTALVWVAEPQKSLPPYL